MTSRRAPAAAQARPIPTVAESANAAANRSTTRFKEKQSRQTAKPSANQPAEKTANRSAKRRPENPAVEPAVRTAGNPAVHAAREPLPAKGSEPAQESTPVRILVVGDWFVDENWIVTTESVPTSAHVGRRQYRSRVEDPDAQILSLCGAGGVASLFHGLGAGSAGRPGVELYGLGLWDPRDTPFLAALFDPQPVVGQTPLTLAGMGWQCAAPAPTSGVASHQSRDCMVCNRKPCARMATLAPEGAGTWRVVRVYQRVGHEAPLLLNRYDWEIRKPPPPGDNQRKKWEKRLQDWPAMDVIIAVDHDKGALSVELVKILQRRFRSARWYARCKDPWAGWLRLVRSRLRLLVVGPMGLELTRDPWFFGQHLSQEALDVLKTLAIGGKRKPAPGNVKTSIAVKNGEADLKHQRELRRLSKAPVVVAYHEDNRVAALDPPRGVVIVATKVPPPPAIRVGRTTNLFATLVAAMESLIPCPPPAGGANPVVPMLRQALDLAHGWCEDIEDILKVEKINWGTPPEINFRRRFGTALARPRSVVSWFHLVEMELAREVQAWSDALDPTGVGRVPSVTTGGKLQLWRGWSAVDGFIAIADARRAVVGRLMREVRQFCQAPSPGHSFSSLLIAGPGMGKSFLTRRLANLLKLPLVEFNITHLTSIDDLIACFDIVSSMQNQDPGRRLVVFWDEINAPLAGEPTYSYFLGPLWDGVYRRGGVTFRLQPGVWIFAGTASPLTKSRHTLKASDFMSRLSGPVIDLRDADSDAVRLERVYTAAALIRRTFPEVLYISTGLLEFFQRAEPFYEIRSLELLVSRMRRVRHGQIRLNNLPEVQDLSALIRIDAPLKRWLAQRQEEEKTDCPLAFIYDSPPYGG
jgi:hypothetical protein